MKLEALSMDSVDELQERIVRAVATASQSLTIINVLSREETLRFSIPLQGQGSGFIYSSDGLIVTNYHVVKDAFSLSVSLCNGATYRGKVIGYDELTDIALVKIDAKGLKEARLGNSDKLRVGEFVLAIGNTLGLPGGPTVSFGVISATNRPLPGADYITEGLIQTDAAVNPGNSGGPLVNINAEVVGVNTAMIPYAQGVGFAIPVNTVRNVAEQIIKQGRVVRPWIGISGIPLNETMSNRYGMSEKSGFLVMDVQQGSPAETAGIRKMDVIVEVDGMKINSARDLISALSAFKDEIELTISRKGVLTRSIVSPSMERRISAE